MGTIRARGSRTNVLLPRAVNGLALASPMAAVQPVSADHCVNRLSHWFDVTIEVFVASSVTTWLYQITPVVAPAFGAGNEVA